MTGRNTTSTWIAFPAASRIGSGKAIEKYLDSGRTYLKGGAAANEGQLTNAANGKPRGRKGSLDLLELFARIFEHNLLLQTHRIPEGQGLSRSEASFSSSNPSSATRIAAEP